MQHTKQSSSSGNPWLSPKSERRQQVAYVVSKLCRRWYDADGKWIAAEREPDTRTQIWLCFGLFPGEESDVALANAILGRVHFEMHGGSGRSDEEGT